MRATRHFQSGDTLVSQLQLQLSIGSLWRFDSNSTIEFYRLFDWKCGLFEKKGQLLWSLLKGRKGVLIMQSQKYALSLFQSDFRTEKELNGGHKPAKKVSKLTTTWWVVTLNLTRAGGGGTEGVFSDCVDRDQKRSCSRSSEAVHKTDSEAVVVVVVCTWEESALNWVWEN